MVSVVSDASPAAALTTVKSVEGRKVTFDVSAKDDIEMVGAGMHARFVVDTAKTVRVRDGRVAEWQVYTDTPEHRAALGLA